MNFDFSTANRILFGWGKLSLISELAMAYGNRPLVVIGRGSANPERLFALLEDNKIERVELVVTGEPAVEDVERGIKLAKDAGCDSVIGFGGGSVLDTGKAISAMLTNPGHLLDYLEVVGRNQPLVKPAAPYIAIPTTAGTGSEVTRNAVMAVPEKQVKVSMRGTFILPACAIVDPELTVTMPPEVTASTGLDALTQVLEPFVSKKANPMTDMFCREGIKRAALSLRKAYQNGDDRAARTDMAWTSLLGGLSLANAGLGAVHGFAGPIGGMFNAPHGSICARLLPYVFSANIKALQKQASGDETLLRYREICQILTGDAKATIEEGQRWLSDLCRDLEVPSLQEYGVKKSEISIIVEKAQASSSMKANPISLTKEELEDILEEAL